MKNDSLEIGTLRSSKDATAHTHQKSLKVSLADMTEDQFRSYKTRLQAESRKAIRAKKANGELPFNSSTTRDALADAAIMLLASKGPGADAIRSYLAKVFPRMPGVPLTVTARAMSGELKPKLLGYAKSSKVPRPLEGPSRADPSL